MYQQRHIMLSASVCSELVDWDSPLSPPSWSVAERQDAEATAEIVEPPGNQAYPNDAVWLARVQAGDEDAARALLQRLYPLVLKSVRCHRSRFHNEEDLAQAVFTKVFTKLNQFSGLVPLEHWVSRIAVNTCMSQISREKVRPELRMSDLTEADQAVVEHLLRTDQQCPARQNRDAQELLEKLLVGLRPDERLVITLLHLEERSTEEISLRTGWSVSRVKVKAFRARHKMRKLWIKLVKEYRAGTGDDSGCAL